MTNYFFPPFLLLLLLPLLLLLAAFFLAGALEPPDFFEDDFFAGIVYPPFQSADAVGVNNFVNKFTTRVSRHQEFFVKVFLANSKTIFKISRAIMIFGAREIVRGASS